MYEYRVVFFDLANASTTFQTYINIALREYLDVFTLAYIDDILIFFKILKKHMQHVRVVIAAHDEALDAGLMETTKLACQEAGRLHGGLVAVVKVARDEERVHGLVETQVDNG